MNWEILQPLTLQIEMDEDGTIILSDDVLNTHGDGDTPEAAMAMWWESVTTYYRLLMEGAHENNANARQLEYIQQYIHHKFEDGDKETV